MERIIEFLREKANSLRKKRARAALGELGRVRGVPARPATLLTLIYLNALYGSLEEAFAPLLGEEPDPARLARLYAILEVSTRESPPKVEDFEGEVRRVEEKLQGANLRELAEMARLLVEAFRVKP